MNWLGILLLTFLISCTRVETIRLPSQSAPDDGKTAPTPNSEPIDVGNGTDDWLDKDHGSWFVPSKDHEEIRVCIRAEEPLIRTSLSWAFDKWKHYMETHGIRPEEVSVFKLNFSGCDSTPDLQILSGPHKAGGPRKAFVSRKGKNESNFWTQGKLWIQAAPSNSQVPAAVYYKALLLHEVGHLLGNPHIKGTIMDDQSLYARLDGGYLDESFLEIDWDLELTGYSPSGGVLLVTHETAFERDQPSKEFFRATLGNAYWREIWEKVSVIAIVRKRTDLSLWELNLKTESDELLATLRPHASALREVGARTRTFIRPSSAGVHPTKMGTYSEFRSQTERLQFETYDGGEFLTAALDYNSYSGEKSYSNHPTRLTFTWKGKEEPLGEFPASPVVTPSFQNLEPGIDP